MIVNICCRQWNVPCGIVLGLFNITSKRRLTFKRPLRVLRSQYTMWKGCVVHRCPPGGITVPPNRPLRGGTPPGAARTSARPGSKRWCLSCGCRRRASCRWSGPGPGWGSCGPVCTDTASRCVRLETRCRSKNARTKCDVKNMFVFCRFFLRNY